MGCLSSDIEHGRNAQVEHHDGLGVGHTLLGFVMLVLVFDFVDYVISAMA